MGARFSVLNLTMISREELREGLVQVPPILKFRENCTLGVTSESLHCVSSLVWNWILSIITFFLRQVWQKSIIVGLLLLIPACAVPRGSVLGPFSLLFIHPPRYALIHSHVTGIGDKLELKMHNSTRQVSVLQGGKNPNTTDPILDRTRQVDTKTTSTTQWWSTWRRRRVAVGGAVDSHREESDQPMTRIWGTPLNHLSEPAPLQPIAPPSDES